MRGALCVVRWTLHVLCEALKLVPPLLIRGMNHALMLEPSVGSGAAARRTGISSRKSEERSIDVLERLKVGYPRYALIKPAI